jgi:hypothetical protein
MNEQRPTPQHGGIHPPAPHAPQPVHSPQPAHHPTGRPSIAAMPVQPIVPGEADLDPIGLVEELTDRPADNGVSKIKAFGVAGGPKAHSAYKRKCVANGTGAVRVRTFHGKLSDQGMEFLDHQINEWLDNHPEVEVKYVSSSVGTFEGKIREPALVLNLWY